MRENKWRNQGFWEGRKEGRLFSTHFLHVTVQSLLSCSEYSECCFTWHLTLLSSFRTPFICDVFLDCWFLKGKTVGTYFNNLVQNACVLFPWKPDHQQTEHTLRSQFPLWQEGHMNRAGPIFRLWWDKRSLQGFQEAGCSCLYQYLIVWGASAK